MRSRRRRNYSNGSSSKPYFLIYLIAGVIFAYFTFSLITSISMTFEQLNNDIETAKATLKKEIRLDETVEQSLEGSRGTYAVAIKNLKTGEEYYKNEDREFLSASLYKLWVLAEAYNQIEEGKLKETTVLNAKIEDVNKRYGIASESAELKEGEFKMPVKNALNQMITISHNYSALILTEKVKLSNVKTFLQENDLNNSKVGTTKTLPKTTAKDTALYFEKLYKGELANPDSSKKMLEMLEKQQLNHKLPKHLPDNITIAHKTGELDEFTHDAGIVYAPKGTYIISVLSESKNPKKAEELIATVSKNVYDYFIAKDNLEQTKAQYQKQLDSASSQLASFTMKVIGGGIAAFVVVAFIIKLLFRRR